MLSFQRAGEGGSPARELMSNGLVRGILNISRNARDSAVKRIGYRICHSVSERGSIFILLQMEVAPRYLYRPLYAQALPAHIEDFFYFFFWEGV